MCYVQQGLVRATRQQLPAWGHPKYHAKLNVMEGHDTWNDSHVVTSTQKAKFQTSYDSMI